MKRRIEPTDSPISLWPLVILLVLLPTLLAAVYIQTGLRSRAGGTPVPYGPGELSDVTIKPQIALVGGQPTVTLTVSGPRVSAYPALTARHEYYYQSGDAQFSPVVQQTTIPLLKANDTFTGSAVLKTGCIDIATATAYLASLCIAVTNGSGSNISAYAADPRLPYRYVSGKYEWGYSRPESYLSGTRTSTDAYYVLSSTLPFDKNLFPYYATGANFVPTNYYWTDTIRDSSYNYTALGDIHVVMIPSPAVPCTVAQAVMNVYADPSAVSSNDYSLINAPWATGGCIFYTYPTIRPIQNFSILRNTYVRLAAASVTPTVTVAPSSTPVVTVPPTATPGPTVTGTPTPTATPRPTPTATPLPTATPKPIPSVTPLPTPVIPPAARCTVTSDCTCGLSITTKLCTIANRAYISGTCPSPYMCYGPTNNCWPACINGRCQRVCTAPSPSPTLKPPWYYFWRYF